ncbi:MAG: TldD/PmbA family protein [Nitrospirae bacterium]|nr:TldD/PmbA family protein [Nitrospirota bacterium]
MNTVSYELLSKLIKKALSKGGDYADVFIEHTRSTFIQIEDDKVEKLVTGLDSGIGIRVIIGEKSAYAYGNDFSEEALYELTAAVSKAALNKDRAVTVDLRKIKPPVDFTIKLKPEDVVIDKKIHLIEKANKTARSAGSEIKQVSVIYKDSSQDICVASSDGVIAEDNRIHTLGVIHVVAEKNSVLQTAYEPVGGLTGFELFDETPFDEMARSAAQKAVAMLSAKKAQGGRMPVIISSMAGGTMIHEAIGHGLEADLVQQGLSIFSNKAGELVASPLITVIDDSTLPSKRGSFRFDDEGSPSQRTILVEKGVLTGYMYDRLTSLKDKKPSSGNGRRESYKHRPIPRMTNTFIAPGSSIPEEIIKSVEKGFFVKKMGGGQVNTATGEFVFEVSEGYLIEKGMLGEPVRGATLIGNGPEILKSIDMVGSDLGFAIGTCGKDMQGVPVSDAMPTVRIPEIVVGGTV